MMSPTITVQKPVASLAIVHHANQFVITDGYDNRTGISELLGTPTSPAGLFKVLQLHERYKVPFSLHISGTLLESIAWHAPGFLSKIEELGKLGLLELVGGSYGQNMLPFFSYDHNLRQLNEELLLYERLLSWNPAKVTTFWPTERLWKTEAMSPVLTDNRLKNGGYRHVLVDDRLLYPTQGNPSPRRMYDHEGTWDPAVFQMYRVRDGRGLCALPISFSLRQNIPPRTMRQLERTKAQLHWILDIGPDYNNQLIAIYGDDMEKIGGVGWDANGPSQFETVLEWISQNPFLRIVKLGEWASSHTASGEKTLDTGAYRELVNEFEAGEDYDKWYSDPQWAPYRDCYVWSENRVREIESKGADEDLIELAWKTLLATVWQTAWHTPRTGAHGEADSDGGPSAWAKAISSHSRIAPIIAEAAYWARHRLDRARAYLQDLDHDGRLELILANKRIFAVFSPRNGGRLVYMFTANRPSGRLVIGNPVDDWNLLEALHDYMDVPPNHPGALSDVGYEHDTYSAEVMVTDGEVVRVGLRNVQENSLAFGVEKKLVLEEGANQIRVEYSLPETLSELSTEIGLSPDYLRLLRKGNRSLKEYSPAPNVRGWVNRETAAWTKIDGRSVSWSKPRQDGFGHGRLLRVTGRDRFRFWVGAGSFVGQADNILQPENEA